jgi:hypothetical protein
VTGGPPRRWDDDSAEEDAEAHRARELARLERWMAEQKTRPLADALEAHGILPGDSDGDGDGWAGPVVLPGWWDEVAAPTDPCPWCQRNVPAAPCPECREGRAADADPPSVRAWWASLTAEARRLHIAASYGTDPWSGRRCTIRIEWSDLAADGQILTRYPLYFGCAPDGIYWGTRRGA